MPHYFAKFVRHGADLFRLDTRVYLDDVFECTSQDFAIGAVIAKNPGSALPTDPKSDSVQQIDLNRGMLLRTLRSVVTKAYLQSNRRWSPGAYIQVLNLFYLCDPIYRSAIRRIGKISAPPIDSAEEKAFPWVLYLWGKSDERVGQFKSRFTALRAKQHFFYDKNLSRLVRNSPTEQSFAKHMQGLPHKSVVDFLAAVIASEA